MSLTPHIDESACLAHAGAARRRSRAPADGPACGWRIEEWEEDRAFVDRQLRGPYRLWHHRHEFAEADGGTRVRDVVHYALPFGPFGELARVMLVRRDLDRIFAYRGEAVERLLGGTTPHGDTASVA